MHSLYWRIFLAFWVALAMILVGTLTVAVRATAHRTDKPWVQRGELYAQAANAFESGGPAALKSWLQGLDADVGDPLLDVVGLEIDPGAGARSLCVAEDGAHDLELVDLDH